MGIYRPKRLKVKRLSDEDHIMVRLLWASGKDTKDISSDLMIPESEVYNFLARIKR